MLLRHKLSAAIKSKSEAYASSVKIRVGLFAPLIAMTALISPAHADNDNGKNPEQNSQPGIRNPEERDGGEKREYRHRVGELDEHGFEWIQFVLIGGALVIAVSLAYNAGKRNRKKNSE